jgi:hypothetical protein
MLHGCVRRSRPGPAVLRFAAAVVLLVLSAGCRGGTVGREYMPLATGSSWEYSVSTSSGSAGNRKIEIVERISDVTWRASEDGQEMYWSWEDDFLSVQHEGVRAYLLVLPANPGAGWWTVTPEGTRVWCSVQKRATVSVPAGTFGNCVEVLMEPVDGRSEIRHWFAPHVGWVRYSYGPRGGRPWMVRELKSWFLAPPDPARRTPSHGGGPLAPPRPAGTELRGDPDG